MVIERKTTATAGSLIRSRATGWTATARVWKINVEAEEYEFRFAETANYYQVWGKITKKGKVLEMEGLPPIKAIFP